jgi:hypothetical protein
MSYMERLCPVWNLRKILMRSQGDVGLLEIIYEMSDSSFKILPRIRVLCFDIEIFRVET